MPAVSSPVRLSRILNTVAGELVDAQDDLATAGCEPTPGEWGRAVDDLQLVIAELATLTAALRDRVGSGAASAALHGAADRLAAAASLAATAHRVMRTDQAATR